MTTTQRPANTRPQDPVDPIQAIPGKDGLYLLTGSGGNVAVLVTDEGAVVVDDKFAHNFEQIVAQVASVTALPVKFVLNTHHHGDHTGSNAQFLASAEVVMHRNARANMVRGDQPGQARLVFNDQQAVFLGGVEVQMHYLGRGHTDGDAVVYFPMLKTVHTGDLIAGSPFIDYGNGASGVEWVATLDNILRLDFDLVIPGHGPLMTKEELRAYRGRFVTLLDRMREYVARDGTRDLAGSVIALGDLGWGGGLLSRSIPGLFDEIALRSTADAVQYKVDPTWPKLPAELFLGTKGGFVGGTPQRGGDADRHYADGTSGIAIGADDQIYVFNRGIPTLMVFDREGNYLRGGGGLDVQGNPVNTGWTHCGTVDWDGNVWAIERDGHRILKFPPDLQRAVLQIGTTNEKGCDETHLNLPNGIVVLRNGNIVVTDGYGNNRVVMYGPNGKFLKQVGKGAGGPTDKGQGPGEFAQPHKLALDAEDTMYIVDRQNRRIQVFDKDLNFLRMYGNDAWVPWAISISRAGTEGYGFFADHPNEEIKQFSLRDGTVLATFGAAGNQPGQFRSLHGLAVDSHGNVYGSDTFGQRAQKFVPVPRPR
ncbi:MAG: MBL fold metallo-hydrolase [Dehalococcoidia bacterium]|nr:MBL fold metallo-hydrolase [Dehalococcoidia bacterium]